MKLRPIDIERLQKAHPDLRRVVEKCAANGKVEFQVGETARSVEQQRKNVAKGVSQTMNSRHIISKDGLSRAVDLLCVVDGKVTWSWPPYYKLAEAVKEAARQEKVQIEWGGDWKTFKDGPHFQLPWKLYP